MAQRKDSWRAGFARSGNRLSTQQIDDLRGRFWRAVEHLRLANNARNPDDILRDVTGVVEEVRRERYETTRRTQGGR